MRAESFISLGCLFVWMVDIVHHVHVLQVFKYLSFRQNQRYIIVAKGSTLVVVHADGIYVR